MSLKDKTVTELQVPRQTILLM